MSEKSMTHKIDSLHYDVEVISSEEKINQIEAQIKDLQRHLKTQRKKISKINKFDCEKVKELPSEVVRHIESFMYDDINTVCKAWRIRNFYAPIFHTNFKHIAGLSINEQYLYHIFKKYDRKKLWRFIMRHRLVTSADYPISKTTPKYELVRYVYKALKIEGFDWNKGLLYQTDYNYVFHVFYENNFGNRIFDEQYRIYQILQIVAKSPPLH